MEKNLNIKNHKDKKVQPFAHCRPPKKSQDYSHEKNSQTPLKK
jgi:hypothetical protein